VEILKVSVAQVESYAGKVGLKILRTMMKSNRTLILDTRLAARDSLLLHTHQLPIVDASQ